MLPTQATPRPNASAQFPLVHFRLDLSAVHALISSSVRTTQTKETPCLPASTPAACRLAPALFAQLQAASAQFRRHARAWCARWRARRRSPWGTSPRLISRCGRPRPLASSPSCKNPTFMSAVLRGGLLCVLCSALPSHRASARRCSSSCLRRCSCTATASNRMNPS